MRMACARARRRCSPAPNPGARGAPTPPSTCGPPIWRPLNRSRRRPVPTAKKPPEGLAFDRLPTPIGEALVMWDAQGALRVFDWSEYEPRMRRQLVRQYGPVSPKRDRAPKGLSTALEAYFDGEIGRIDAITCATAGTPFQQMVWAALRTIPAGTTWSYSGLADRIGRP